MKNYKLIENSVRGINSIKDTQTINDRIDFVRCTLGYSITSFSAKIGSSKSALINVLDARKKILPPMKMVQNILQAFPIDEVWMYNGIGKPFTKDIKDLIVTNQKANEIDTSISARLKEIRESQDLTQALFATELGVSRDSYAFVESNRTNPTVDLIKRVVLKYKVSPTWLLFGSGKRHANVLNT